MAAVILAQSSTYRSGHATSQPAMQPTGIEISPSSTTAKQAGNTMGISHMTSRFVTGAASWSVPKCRALKGRAKAMEPMVPEKVAVK